MMNRMNNEPVAAPPPVQVRDKRGEFLKGRPPVFTHASDPLEADDWLKAVEKQLNIAQCSDLEKCCTPRASCKDLLRSGGSLINMDARTMLRQSPGRSLLKGSGPIIFQRA